MEEESSSPPPRQQQNYRATASSNWRMKDDLPRVDQPQSRTRNNRDDSQTDSRSRSYNNRGQRSSDENNSGTRLYVGNLLYSAQRSDIEDVFKNQGFNVVNVSISLDPFSGRNPSYCFVDVDTPEEAQRAISELNGVDVLGRPLRVSPGVAKRQGQGSGEGVERRTNDYARGSGRGYGGEREPREKRDGDYNPSFERRNRTEGQSYGSAPQSDGRRLYVGNMPRLEPQSVHDQEIQTLFNQYVPGVTLANISKQISPRVDPKPEYGPNQHFCFVDLEEGEDLDAVIEALNGKEGSWGGNVKVNRARNSDRKPAREQGFSGGQEKPERERRVIEDGPWRRG